MKALAVRRLYREPENGSCLSASDWLRQSYFSLKQNELFMQSLMWKISQDFVQMYVSAYFWNALVLQLLLLLANAQAVFVMLSVL